MNKAENITPFNPCSIAQDQISHVAKGFGQEHATRDFIHLPMRDYQFSIPVRSVDGSDKVLLGNRIQHNDAHGPCRSGVRFHIQKSVDILNTIAKCMTWQSTVVDIPLGRSLEESLAIHTH